jgi:hypothetical protein
MKDNAMPLAATTAMMERQFGLLRSKSFASPITGGFAKKITAISQQ